MSIIAKISRGDGNGRKVLGFPTANAIMDKYKLDSNSRYTKNKEGAWFVYVRIPNLKAGLQSQYKGVCGISSKGSNYILETHIFDFDGDLYDRDTIIDLTYKIRDVIVFKNLEESKSQIIKDINFARRYRSCSDCQFCVYQDHGYSNYTVEGTSISCLVNKFEEIDEYSDRNTLGMATDCEYFNQGNHWDLDVNGESFGPTDEWFKNELRDIKLKNILNQ